MPAHAAGRRHLRWDVLGVMGLDLAMWVGFIALVVHFAGGRAQ